MSDGIELVQQYWVPSRQGGWMDVVSNAIGIGMSAIVWSVIFARRKNLKVMTKVRCYER